MCRSNRLVGESGIEIRGHGLDSGLNLSQTDEGRTAERR